MPLVIYNYIIVLAGEGKDGGVGGVGGWLAAGRWAGWPVRQTGGW